jgi:S-adenosylmethionine hydrolase
LERKEMSDKLFSSKKGGAELRKSVACSSDEDTEDENAPEETIDSDEAAEKQQKKVNTIDKYKNLLSEIKKKETDKKKNKIEMEYTWSMGHWIGMSNKQRWTLM